MLEKFFIGLVIVVIIGALGFGILRYLQGYDYMQIVGIGQPALSLPDQNSFPSGAVNFNIMRFLATRWGDDPNNLEVMAVRSLNPTDLNVTSFEEAILDTSNLDSARIVVVNENLFQPMVANAIDHIENAYLMEEFVPSTLMQQQLVHQFYYSAPPGLLITRNFAAITQWNVSADGNGSIGVLTNQGDMTVPVKLGLIFKRMTY